MDAAAFLDGLDGSIARFTNTTSDFGREMDSLADVITFGVAPALLAYMWGFHLLPPIDPEFRLRLGQLGALDVRRGGSIRSGERAAQLRLRR